MPPPPICLGWGAPSTAVLPHSHLLLWPSSLGSSLDFLSALLWASISSASFVLVGAHKTHPLIPLVVPGLLTSGFRGTVYESRSGLGLSGPAFRRAGADAAAPRIGIGPLRWVLDPTLWCPGLLHQPDLRRCLREAGLSPRWVIATAWLLKSVLCQADAVSAQKDVGYLSP